MGECIFLVEHYIKKASFKECQIAFKSRFGGRKKPSKSVMWKLGKQFRETGCVKVKKHMRQPSVVTPEKVDEVWERMGKNGSKPK